MGQVHVLGGLAALDFAVVLLDSGVVSVRWNQVNSRRAMLANGTFGLSQLFVDLLHF